MNSVTFTHLLYIEHDDDLNDYNDRGEWTEEQAGP